VFPNPAAGGTTLRFAGNGNEMLDLALYEISGKLVFDKRIDTEEGLIPETSLLKPGIYLLRFRTKSGVYLQEKVVITE
jgi:hypothetical protein